MSKLINITELSKSLNLINKSNNKPLNHVLRYWEKEFKQIKPKKINNRRYYSQKQVEIIKKIQFLLKTKGMTISGVKNVLNTKINKLDDYNSNSLKADYQLRVLNKKSKKVLEKIKKLKLLWQKKHT
ncbi:MerR family transcriptional regulator [Pelagibacteraceae bacterium]|nr:MerR family transcriptional regulator [Pelagibacteraceae bacterium]